MTREEAIDKLNNKGFEISEFAIELVIQSGVIENAK